MAKCLFAEAKPRTKLQGNRGLEYAKFARGA